MNTLYEQINYACERGYYPIVSYGEDYIIVSPFKDSDGDWRNTIAYHSPEEASENIGDRAGNTKAHWNGLESRGYKLTGYYKPQYKRFEAGEKVRAVEYLEEVLGNYYVSGLLDLAGKVCEIKGYNGDNVYDVYTPDKSNFWQVTTECIEPYFETPGKQTIKVGDDEYIVTDELLEALKGLKKG